MIDVVKKFFAKTWCQQADNSNGDNEYSKTHDFTPFVITGCNRKK